MTVRTPAASVRCISRRTQGVKIIATDVGDRVSSVAAVVPDQEEDEAAAQPDEAASEGAD